MYIAYLQIVVRIVKSHVYCSSWCTNNVSLDSCHITEEENFMEWYICWWNKELWEN